MQTNSEPRLNGDRRLAAVFVAVLFSLLIVQAHHLGVPPIREDPYGDFKQFYGTAQAMLHGGSLYPPVDQGFRTVYNLNPPHFHLLVIPLTAAPLASAFALWMLASLLALIPPLWFVAVERIRARTTPLVPALLIVWLISTPLAASVLVTGAPVWLLSPLAWGAWQADRTGRKCIAGACVGVLIAFKLFLLPLMLWLMLRRQWSAVAVATASGAALVVAGLMLVGTTGYMEWLHALAYSPTWAWNPLNTSVVGGLSRIVNSNPLWASAETPVRHLQWALICQVIIAAITGCAIWQARNDVDLSWSLMLTAALLISPAGWLYYAWWLWPLAIVWRWNALTVGAALLLLIPPRITVFGQPSVLLTATLGCAYMWALCLIWCECVSRSLWFPPKNLIGGVRALRMGTVPNHATGTETSHPQ